MKSLFHLKISEKFPISFIFMVSLHILFVSIAALGIRIQCYVGVN